MADLSERLQAALAPRYQIERALGHGGMASVYLARDLKERSRRFVAIKVLDPETALAVRTERFLREIEIAGTLTHTGILPLHESGEVDGFHYYVMPFVSGPSLKERLAVTGRLQITEAVRIAGKVAEALAYAHGRGIVHRDITPANLLFIENDPVIADFGIARGIDREPSADITDKGSAIGTPAYMSPEQVRGADVDARSDIYSLGCVLYEMLEGRPPFVGPTGDAVRAQHLADPVLPLRRRGLPAALRRAVLRALAKDPAERFARAEDFGSALDQGVVARFPRVSTAVLLIAVAAAGLLGGGSEPESRLSSIAVLPFHNMSGDTALQYFSDGITEEIITALEQVEGLRVIPRTTSFAFAGQAIDVREIGRMLEVEYILESSVRSERDSLRIVARLVRAPDRSHVRTWTFDKARRNVMELQEDIAWAILRYLDVPLTGRETRVVRRYTENEVAYDLYLRGRGFWRQRSADSIARAINYFQLAVAQDSNYAIAYSGLADAFLLAGQYRYLPRDEAFPRAKTAALRALALDEELAEAHTSLAKVHQNYDWDWQAAEREYRRAIALNPRYALARTWYGMFLARTLGRHSEALRHAREGQRFDPLSPWANNNLSVVLNFARRHEEAMDYARRAIKLAPDWSTPRGQLATAYLWSGRLQEALTEIETARRLNNRSHGPRHIAGIAYARLGRRSEALAVVRDLLQTDGDKPWVALATVYAALGDADHAVAALDSAITRRAFPGDPTLASSPDWDPLRSDPRFTALLRRIGLPP